MDERKRHPYLWYGEIVIAAIVLVIMICALIWAIVIHITSAVGSGDLPPPTQQERRIEIKPLVPDTLVEESRPSRSR